jgi:N-acetylglucosamine-6-phosphate deacetylase
VTTVLASSTVCAPGTPAPGWLAIDGGTIVEVGWDRPPTGALDLGDALLTPGFVDLQCNGVGFVDLADATAGAWEEARRLLLGHGVTAFCPTFVSSPIERYGAFLEATQRATLDGETLAVVLGAHLEGPFLGGAPGAHPVEHLRTVDLEWLRQLVAGADPVRMVTIAPEADPGLHGIRALAAGGVVVALGHSRADYELATAAADAGATVVTHVFNGMGPLHHRDPGLAGAALADDRLTPTVIADLVHVHPATLRLVLACKPATAVVSDAVTVRAGTLDAAGAVRLPDGTLAGATTMLDGSLRNLVTAGVPLPLAVRAVSASPAELIGAHRHGRLSPGARADVVALDAATLQVRRVWLAGVPVR